MDSTDDEEQVVQTYPIEISKPSPSDVATIDTYKPSHIDVVPTVATKAPVDIVKRAPI